MRLAASRELGDSINVDHRMGFLRPGVIQYITITRRPKVQDLPLIRVAVSSTV